MAAFFLFMQRQFDPIEDRGEPPHLANSDTAAHVVTASEGQRMFVLGRVQNTSRQDAATVWFRVNLFDDANHVVDSFLAQSPGLIVPGNGSVAFRVFGPISVAAAVGHRARLAYANHRAAA
jgi:hypothetical protein